MTANTVRLNLATIRCFSNPIKHPSLHSLYRRCLGVLHGLTLPWLEGRVKGFPWKVERLYHALPGFTFSDGAGTALRRLDPVLPDHEDRRVFDLLHHEGLAGDDEHLLARLGRQQREPVVVHQGRDNVTEEDSVHTRLEVHVFVPFCLCFYQLPLGESSTFLSLFVLASFPFDDLVISRQAREVKALS